LVRLRPGKVESTPVSDKENAMRSWSTRAVGLLILALGLWGGLVPFVGHYFHFALGPDKSWTWTSGRFYLSVLPGVVAAVGGLMLIGSGPRSSARLGALLALAAGAWFAIGPQVSLLWNVAGAQGPAHGSKVVRVLEMLTYHTALGVAITALAAYALPRFPKRALAAEAGEVRAAVAAEHAAPRGAQPAATYQGSVADEPVATRRDAVADEPAPTRREPVVAGDAPTTVREHGYDGGAPAGDHGYIEQPPAPEREYRDGGAVGEHPYAGAAPAHNGEGDRSEVPAATGAASEQPAAAPATVLGRRRRGGLLSFLRR
jgi:hypothetical protein